ncbi:DUF3017 domain-containing protein [Ornithinimicrobium sp. Y1847]|uniref:DUF3017 domain-containing protein n=1 Tax=unclassified Ornithinimicrobium TaxID=2615080 RepID=UPI003B66BCD3
MTDPTTGVGSDEERRAAAPWQPLGAWWVPVLGLLVAAVMLVTDSLRAYGYAVAAAMAVAAVLRLVLPAARAGGLVVRSRWIDAATMLALGAAIATIAATLRLG